MPTTRYPNKSSYADVLVAGRGLIAESIYPAMIAANQALTSQTIHATALALRAGDTVSAISVLVGTAAAGTTPTLVKLALMKSDGTVLAQTANVTADAQLTATGWASFSFAASATIPSDDVYYGAILQNGSFGTTQPAFGRGLSSGAFVVAQNGGKKIALSRTGQTDFPSTGSAIALTSGTSTASLYFGVY